LLSKTKTYANATVTRTRDPEVLATMDIVVDVGGVYDDAKRRYDHHQKGFLETFDDEHKIKLSSAGLVYKHFGREIIGNMLPALKQSDVELIFQRIYNGFVQGIDAVDNGIAQYGKEAGKPAYTLRTDLSARVSYLNPLWNEKGVDIDARFDEASAMTGAEFTGFVMRSARGWLPARTVTEQALLARTTRHASGRIVVFDTYTAWKSHIYDLETEHKIDKAKLPLYVLYTDARGAWRIQCVPVSGGSFESRKALPAAWRGVRNEALDKISGIEGCIFCHAGGFIGGNKTFDGALAMAAAALEDTGAAAVAETAEVKEPATKKQKTDK
jgi:uncharacterized UPF0160 family protein